MTAPKPSDPALIADPVRPGPLDQWDYRVLRDEHGVFSILEVYYNADGSISSWCKAAPMGETLDELHSDLRHHLAALAEPVLTYGETEEGDGTLIDGSKGSL